MSAYDPPSCAELRNTVYYRLLIPYSKPIYIYTLITTYKLYLRLILPWRGLRILNMHIMHALHNQKATYSDQNMLKLVRPHFQSDSANAFFLRGLIAFLIPCNMESQLFVLLYKLLSYLVRALDSFQVLS